MNRSLRTVDRRLFFAYVVCSLIAIFYLPYLVPLPPTASDSYIFGYNNRVGIVLLVLLVTIGSVWFRGLNLQFCAGGPSRPVSLKILVASLIAVLLGCLTMYAVAGRFGGFGESSYEIDRLWLLSQGKIPYVDFEWPFGASFLYVPLLLQRILSITLVQAYYLFWTLNWLLGTVLLFVVVNMVDYPTKFKTSIFLLLYGAGFISILSMGTHAASLRYTCPLFFILVVYKLLNHSGTKWQIYSAIFAVAFTMILLLISPETAIAYAFACGCVFVKSSTARRSRSFALFGGLLLAFAVVFWAALKFHVLDTVKASGGGADSYPVYFAPNILLFFAALFVCSCYLVRRFFVQQINDNTIGLIAFSIPMIAAALGHCGPSHVFWNGEGSFLVSLFYVSNYKIAWKWYRAAFILVMILFQALFTGWYYSGAMASVGSDLLRGRGNNSQMRSCVIYLSEEYIATFVRSDKKADWEARLARAERPAMPDKIDFAHVYPSWHGTFLAPFGYTPNGLGTYLSDKIDYGRYEGFENANTLAAIHEKGAEIKDHPERALLLPEQFEHTCKIDVSAERRKLSALYMFPYLGRAVHPESVRKPVCAYILTQYRLEQEPDEENFWYGLWVVKPVEAP